MIAVRPGSDAWRVLELVVRRPGQLDAAEIGSLLWRPRWRTKEEYFAARSVIVRESSTWTSRVGVFLNRLQERGYIEHCRPPVVAPKWAALARRKPARAIAEASEEEIERSPEDPRVRLLGELARRKTPCSAQEWVTGTPTGSGPRPPVWGNVQRAVADLVEWGLVIPPTSRWPTPAGIALITGATSPAVSA